VASLLPLLEKRSTGLEPPAVIEAGKLHRFPGIGKRNGNTAGWCKLFADGLGGCFGDWSSGFSEHWQAKRDQPFTPAERDVFERHVAEAQAQAEAERQAKQAEAATKAATIWKEAVPAPKDHPYLVQKGIQANGARLYQGALLIPMRQGGEIHSLQFIGPAGERDRGQENAPLRPSPAN
jgi:putative DNA primase/helicase